MEDPWKEENWRLFKLECRVGGLISLACYSVFWLLGFAAMHFH